MIRYITTNWITSPTWVKTTIASWMSTLTGVGVFDWLSANQSAIQALAAIIGGILVPTALAIHSILKKKDK